MSFIGGSAGGGQGVTASGSSTGSPGSAGSASSLLAQIPFGPSFNLPGVTAGDFLSNTSPTYSSTANFSALGASSGSSGASDNIPAGASSAGSHLFANAGNTSGSSMIAPSGAGSSLFAHGSSF